LTFVAPLGLSGLGSKCRPLQGVEASFADFFWAAQLASVGLTWTIAIDVPQGRFSEIDEKRRKSRGCTNGKGNSRTHEALGPFASLSDQI